MYNTIFKNLIDDVMNLLILNFSDELELKNQYEKLKISDIEVDASGFYCYFEPMFNCPILSTKHMPFGDVYGRINGIPVGFIMFFNKDKNIIDCLECYVESDEIFPNYVDDICNYSVYKRS